MSKTTIVCAWLVCALGACATGGSTGNDTNGSADASVVRYDANASQLVDASVRNDGSVVHQDAQQAVDAGGGSGSGSGGGGLFCTTNSQCTNAGECCLTLGGPSGFCGPGTVVLGSCLPVN